MSIRATSFASLILACILAAMLCYSLTQAPTVSASGGTGATPGGASTPGNASNPVFNGGTPGGVVPIPGPKYTPLAGIPGLTTTNGEVPKIPDLIEALYRLAIIVGAIYGVVRITIAGIKYMTTQSVGNKNEAKKDIQNVLFGLLILLAAVLILRTIIGDVKTDFVRNIPALQIDQAAIGIPNPNLGGAGQNAMVSTNGCNQVRADPFQLPNATPWSPLGVGAGIANTAIRAVDALISPDGQYSCPSGSTGRFNGRKVECQFSDQVVPGQAVFKYATQNSCGTAMGNAIKANKEIYGETASIDHSVVTQGGRTVQQYIDQVIKPQCQAINPNATVSVTGEPTQNTDCGMMSVGCPITYSGGYSFMCTS